MDETETYTASICTDCYMFNHYGDGSTWWSYSFGDHVTPEMANDIRQGFDKLGNVITGDHHGEHCTQEYDSLCHCDETYFSWSPCEICKSSLGGDRHEIDIVTMEKIERIEVK